MTPHLQALSFVAALLPLALPTSASAQQATDMFAGSRAANRALAATIARSPQVLGHVLNVKLREGCGAELVRGRLRSRTGVELAAVQALFDRAVSTPLFTAAPWDELDQLHRRAVENLPPQSRPGHLGLWYRLELPSAAAADLLAEELWRLDLVDNVLKEPLASTASCGPLPVPAPLPLPNDIPPPTPDFTSMQQNFLPSPLGHGIWQAQGVLGARGQGIGFLMVESEWVFDHEDVSQCVPSHVIGPLPGSSTTEAYHGTAGASAISADRNEYGITGIADECNLRFLSQLTNGGVANSLLVAGTNSQPGDVVMLVMMFLFAQNGLQDWVPYEILQQVYDATATLTGNGLIVAVSAGNGDNDLDDPRFLRRFDRTFRDSGALFCTSSMAVTLDKAPFSNYGSRIDANGWGDQVLGCGIGTLFFPNMDRRQAYTASYTGTSAAVPAIAGIVTALQGAAVRQLGQRLTLAQIQQLLWTHGPLSPDAIGRRPDLYAMLQTMGAADGLDVSEPDVAIGSSETVTVSGPAGSGALLFASFATGNTPLGYNRPLHLPLGSTLTLGFLPLPQGTANVPIAVPNDPGLRGLSIYLQAGVLTGAMLHVTNSAQLTIV